MHLFLYYCTAMSQKTRRSNGVLEVLFLLTCVTQKPCHQTSANIKKSPDDIAPRRKGCVWFWLEWLPCFCHLTQCKMLGKKYFLFFPKYFFKKKHTHSTGIHKIVHCTTESSNSQQELKPQIHFRSWHLGKQYIL